MTIDFQPTGYNAYGSGAELVYIVSDANYTQEKFRYIAQVYIDGTSVSKLKALPNTSNKGVFDIANIVRDYVEPQVEFNTANFENDEVGSRQVYVKFGYEYAVNTTSVPTETLNLATSTSIEVTSGAYQAFGDNYGDLFVDDFDISSTLSPFLSRYNVSNHRVVEVTDNDWGTMTLFREGTTGTSINLAIQFYDADGTLIPDGTYQYGLLTGAFNQITGNGIAHLGLYPENLRANTTSSPSLGSVNPDDYPNWDTYKIKLSSSLTTTLMTFKRRPACNDRVRFAWWNTYGGWDFINCYGIESESERVERKTFRTYGGNSFSALNSYTHTAQEGIGSGGRTKRIRTGRVNTNWLPEWMNDVITDFFASPVKYVQVGDNWLPVQLNEDSIQIRNQRADKVWEYDFSYDYTNPYPAIG